MRVQPMEVADLEAQKNESGLKKNKRKILIGALVLIGVVTLVLVLVLGKGSAPVPPSPPTPPHPPTVLNPYKVDKDSIVD